LERLMSKKDPPVEPVRRAARDAPVMRKRFYKAVSVATLEGGYQVHLDGRALKTPRKLPMLLGQKLLAAAIAAEWDAQGTDILPASMQLTTLVFTALDAVAGQHGAVADEIARYATSDLLCYRAQDPEELVQRQSAGWEPLVVWAEQTLAVKFKRTSGLMPVAQEPAIAAAVTTRLSAAPPIELAAMHVLTTMMGSTILALAVRERRLTLDEAWALAHIDETWQIEKWGTDAEAQTRHAIRLSTARAAAAAMAFVRS
jgi:chaperone required for assembly of F1-ATPase